MKVITLISGGDSGGAKTHVHSLLQNLSRTIEVTMVCFLRAPSPRRPGSWASPQWCSPAAICCSTYRTLKRMIREGGISSSTATARGAT